MLFLGLMNNSLTIKVIDNKISLLFEYMHYSHYITYHYYNYIAWMLRNISLRLILVSLYPNLIKLYILRYVMTANMSKIFE